MCTCLHGDTEQVGAIRGGKIHGVVKIWEGFLEEVPIQDKQSGSLALAAMEPGGAKARCITRQGIS